MTITESQRRTLDLMAESAGWGWADVEALSQEMFREDVAGLTKRRAVRLTVELGHAIGHVCDDHAERTCDYVTVRTAANAQRCGRCGADAWDICYDTFYCDKHVAIIDAGYNEFQRREQANKLMQALADAQTEGE